jgi:hypothetical protein
MSVKKKKSGHQYCFYPYIPVDMRADIKRRWDQAGESAKTRIAQSWVVYKGADRTKHEYTFDGVHRVCLRHVTQILHTSRRRLRALAHTRSIWDDLYYLATVADTFYV